MARVALDYLLLLFLLLLLEVNGDLCSNGTFGKDCQYVMNGNCAVYAANTSHVHVCVNFEYFDCEDKLEVMIYQNLENPYGEEYIFPIGSHKEFFFPDSWVGNAICETLSTDLCDYGECPQYCVRLANVTVVPNVINVCASIKIFGHNSLFPYQFCQTISYSVCGQVGYYYPPCEHFYADTILWDSAFLSSLDTPEISNLPFEYFQGSESLCLFLENTTSEISYPFECITFVWDSCNPGDAVMVANGYIPFATQVTGAGMYCFGSSYGDEMFCVELQNYQIDHKLREIIVVPRLSYTNSKHFDNNTISIVFGESSLHYPSCGAIKCAPGNHSPINWALVNDPYNAESIHQASVNTEQDEETGNHKKPKKSSSNLTWLWILLSLGGGFLVVSAVASVFFFAVLTKKKIAKRGALLDQVDEEMEYEMMELSNASPTSEDPVDDISEGTVSDYDSDIEDDF